MIAIPNMDKPRSCYNHCEFIAMEEVGCPLKDYIESHQYKDRIHPDCQLIEVDDELIKKLQESAIVIKAVFNRLKKMVNDSDELKAELMGLNPNLTIFDEANAIQDVESVGERRTDD